MKSILHWTCKKCEQLNHIDRKICVGCGDKPKTIKANHEERGLFSELNPRQHLLSERNFVTRSEQTRKKSEDLRNC